MERIGRYEIIRELGRGSMSIVYAGFDGRIDRHLAIKVLRSQYARDVGARQRFLREARAAGGLGHPNIVTVFDVGQVDGSPYMVMEMLPGGTLAEWLNSGRIQELGIEQILKLAAQLAGGLAYAHQHGVIHRDIKPANIHFDPDTGTSKMMDFGIAAIERGQHRRDHPNQISGTLTHMAPELLQGQPADARSDLYAFGIVLYQLLTGRLPYDAGDSAVLVKQIVSHSIVPLKPLRTDTPRELIDLVYRLIALEPDSRPASARQVLQEIEEIKSGLKRGLLQTVRHKSAVWQWPLVIGSAVALVLVLGLGHVYQTQNEAMNEAAYGFGDAMASLVAQETAEALILEDTTALSILVTDFSVNPQIDYLHISDPNGITQASTNPYLQGEATPVSTGVPILRSSGNVLLHRSDQDVLEFQVPIRFQARRVGSVHLGLDASALASTATTTLWMLIAVFTASLLAVALGLAWMVRRQQRALRRLVWGLKRLYRNQYDFRLEAERKDEFSAVYKQFNRLAVLLDERTRSLNTGSATSTEKNSMRLQIPDAASPDETLDLADSTPDEPLTGPSEDNVTPLKPQAGNSTRRS
ncbi:MAG: serine/threonine-protein kinase [Wenzhouxiangellaceae bacterium]|nr:serine/threonine-protein kinase [Wenzhouxiangellaceae bacterium]